MSYLLQHPADQRAIIRTLVGEIEALREQRRIQHAQQPLSNSKRFTQEELADHCRLSYKNLLYGYTNRLPSRAHVLVIADYLECTITETNDLLAAAEYMPVQVELRADHEQAVLEQATFYVHTLPLPAIVFRRGWEIVAVNRFQLTLNLLPSLDIIPHEKRTAVHWLCDPTLPSHRVHAPNSATWQANVQDLAGLFRTSLQPFQRESWLRAQMERWRALPMFARVWAEIGANPPHAADHFEFATTTASAFAPTLIRERNLIVPLGPAFFPLIIVVFPWDAGAYASYRDAGCVINEDGWQRAVSDLQKKNI
jgi:hypothetical protein